MTYDIIACMDPNMILHRFPGGYTVSFQPCHKDMESSPRY